MLKKHKVRTNNVFTFVFMVGLLYNINEYLI